MPPDPTPDYRYKVDYLAEQLREYINRTMQEGADYTRTQVGDTPGLAERLRGYEDAMEDVQKMLRDSTHQFHRGLARYIHAARQLNQPTPTGRTYVKILPEEG